MVEVSTKSQSIADSEASYLENLSFENIFSQSHARVTLIYETENLEILKSIDAIKIASTFESFKKKKKSLEKSLTSFLDFINYSYQKNVLYLMTRDDIIKNRLKAVKEHEHDGILNLYLDKEFKKEPLEINDYTLFSSLKAYKKIIKTPFQFYGFSIRKLEKIEKTQISICFNIKIPTKSQFQTLVIDDTLNIKKDTRLQIAFINSILLASTFINLQLDDLCKQGFENWRNNNLDYFIYVYKDSLSVFDKQKLTFSKKLLPKYEKNLQKAHYLKSIFENLYETFKKKLICVKLIILLLLLLTLT